MRGFFKFIGILILFVQGDRLIVCPRFWLRRRGFTLLELVVSVAVVAVLVALAVPSYRLYVERAQLAQLLLQIDQISTAVQIEDATGRRALQRGAQPGKAPPRLQVVPDAAFSEPGGLRLLLIRAPAGFFASSPSAARYGLIADLTGNASPERLAQLRQVLPFDAGDKIWLTADTLAFPLVNRAAAGAVVPPTGGGDWEDGSTPGPNNTWTCAATLSVYGTDGKLLTGVNAGIHVKVILDVTTWDGQKTQRSWDDLGNLTDGKTSFKVDGLSANASHGELVTGCRFEVTGVSYYWPTDPPIRWNGKLSSIQIAMPVATRAAQSAPAAAPVSSSSPSATQR